MEMYNKAVEEYVKHRPNRLYSIYSKIGDSDFEFGEYRQALEMYNKSVEEYVEHRPTRLYSIYPKVGDAYLALGEYDKAIENYNKTIELAATAGIENMYVAGAYKCLGIVYTELGENEKARAALEKAKSLYEKYRPAVGAMENIEEIQQLLGGL